ncbi:oxidoreductase [Polyangium sp. 6x1]|uniref:oxidoreductase n=1 Tax=Polyangium sp. 6x1 TaxID=3042689 RepID=UPI0024823EF5|nr:oxidoreductase [Polyangium sp. 6x1]MDI1447052.1 oxidoreductase [Polyangium sp. 6x1]
MANWKLSDIPDLSGKTAVVTGGNVGLGFKSALELARKGAEIVIGCRRLVSGEEAIGRIRQELPAAKLSCVALDLTNLASVAAFGAAYKERHVRLDILMNNAGVVNLETLQRTSDGHEMHMATNHYGHFALTAHLFGLLCRTRGARVVTLTSGSYRMGEIRLDDMDWRKRRYSRRSYGDSKLANLLFMRSLQQRFDAAEADAISVAAHPGLTGTERQQSIGVGGMLAKWIASPVSVGVAPQLRAATDPGVRKCELYGPRYVIRGDAVANEIKGHGTDAALAERLWSFTEELTNCRFEAAR